MKTKFYWVALLASAALIAQAKAGGHHEGGGGFAGGGHAIVAGGSPRIPSRTARQLRCRTLHGSRAALLIIPIADGIWSAALCWF